MQNSNENNKCFSHNLFNIFMLQQSVNFLFALKLYSYFYKIQISSNYENIIIKLIVFFVAFAGPGTILPIVREITLIYKKVLKSIILESNRECENDIFLLYYPYQTTASRTVFFICSAFSIISRYVYFFLSSVTELSTKNASFEVSGTDTLFIRAIFLMISSAFSTFLLAMSHRKLSGMYLVKIIDIGMNLAKITHTSMNLA